MIKIVVLGGGFGGVAAVKTLLKHRLRGISITLIDKRNYHLFTPSLYEVATSEEPQKNIAIPFSELFNNSVSVVSETITSIDPKNKKIITDTNKYEFDYLIIALGSETACFHIPGLEDYGLPLKKISDAVKIKDTIHKLFDQKAAKGETVNVVIGGGGFSGTELAAELVTYRKRLALEHKISEKLLQFSILQGSDRLLKELDPKVSVLSMKRLKNDITMDFGGHITKVTKEIIETDNKKSIAYDVLIWTGGVCANILLKTSGFITNKNGQVLINQFLQITSFSNIFVIGDCAEFIDPISNNPAPGVAQVAEDEGKVAAKNIVRLITHKQLLPYRYNHFGYIVPLRGHYAVFASKHFYLHGFLGWVIQQIVFLRYLLGILPVTKAFKKWNQFERNLTTD